MTSIDSIASGRTLESNKPQAKRVLSDGVAYEANKVLEGPICCGTAAATAQFPDGRVEAGKTGTTNDYKDAWFCGYTPNLTTCVWMGYPKGEITLTNLNGHTPVRRRHPGHDLAHLHGAGVRARAEEVPGGLRLAAAQASRAVGAVPLAVPDLRALHGQVPPQDHQERGRCYQRRRHQRRRHQRRNRWRWRWWRQRRATALDLISG